jgi:hypothetical protein
MKKVLVPSESLSCSPLFRPLQRNSVLAIWIQWAWKRNCTSPCRARSHAEASTRYQIRVYEGADLGPLWSCGLVSGRSSDDARRRRSRQEARRVRVLFVSLSKRQRPAGKRRRSRSTRFLFRSNDEAR